MTQSNKLEALKSAAQAKRKSTLLKTETTLRIMQTQNLPINFESVAKLAGVSKTWLYQQEKLSAEIRNLRNKEGKIQRLINMRSIVVNKNTEIDTLKIKNKRFKATIKELRSQLEIVYGELYKLKKSTSIL